MDHAALIAWLFTERTVEPIVECSPAVEHLRVLEAEALLASRIKERGWFEDLPEESKAPLTAAHVENVTHALALEHELRAILEEADRRAIVMAPLKGSSLLLHGIHRDLGSRYFHDIDLLSRRADRAQIDALLRARGFVVSPEAESLKHLLPYVRGSVCIEVHEYAYWENDGTVVDLDRWLGAQRSLAHTIVHLVHHLFVSSVFEPALVLKTLWDFRELCRHDFVPWDEATELARRAGLGGELQRLIGAGRDLMSGRLDSPDARWAIDACRPISSAELRRRELELFARFALRAPPWVRLGLIRVAIAPTRRTIERTYGLREGSPWALPAYAVRPFHLAGRMAKELVTRRASTTRGPREL